MAEVPRLYLKRRGWCQRDIAEALDASEVSVSRWLADARDGGPDALGATPVGESAEALARHRSGRSLSSSGTGRRRTASAARSGPAPASPRSSRRSSASATTRTTSAGCSRTGWTPQQPIKRAIQRDEDAIRRWRRGPGRSCGGGPPRAPGAGFRGRIGVLPAPRAVKTYAPEARPRCSARSRRGTTCRSWGG